MNTRILHQILHFLTFPIGQHLVPFVLFSVATELVHFTNTNPKHTIVVVMSAPEEKLTVKSLYKELGEARIAALSQAFYDRVYGKELIFKKSNQIKSNKISTYHLKHFFISKADEEAPWFRDMFAITAATPKELAAYSQMTFFVQKFGGDPYYGGMVKDSSFMREVHQHFAITQKGYERWMKHMRETLEVVDLGPRAAEVKQVLLAYFSAFGKSIINKEDNDDDDDEEKAAQNKVQTVKQ